MKLRTLFSLSVACLAVGCVNMNVSDDVGLTETFSYPLPTVPAGVAAPVYSHTFVQSKEENVSDVISKLNGIGTTTFAVSTSSAMANMPLGFLTHVTVDMYTKPWKDCNGIRVCILQSGGQDLVVVDTDINTTGDTLTLPVVASSSDLLSTLGSGQVTISVSLTVSTASGEIPSGTLDLTYTLGLNAQVNVKK